MATITWEGRVDTKWSDGENWSFPRSVPGSTDDVIIADAAPNPQPVCDVNPGVKTITIQVNATVDLNGKTMTVKDTYTNDGTLLDNSGGILLFDSFGACNLDAGGAGSQWAIPWVAVRLFLTVLTLINTDCQVDGLLHLDLSGNIDLNDLNLKAGSIQISSGSIWTKGTGILTLLGGTLRDDNGTKRDLGDTVVDGSVSLITDIQVSALTVNASKQIDTDSYTLQISGHLVVAASGIINATGSIKFNGTAQNITSNDNDLDDIEVASGCTLTLQDNLHVNDILNEGTVDYNGHTLTVDGEQTGEGSYIGEQGGGGGSSGERKRVAFALLAESEKSDI